MVLNICCCSCSRHYVVPAGAAVDMAGTEGKKWIYQPAEGILDLYQRCGGTAFVEEMAGTHAARMKDLLKLPHFIELEKVRL